MKKEDTTYYRSYPQNEGTTYYQMVIKKLCPNLSKKEYEAKKQNISNDFEIIKIENPNVTKEEYVECFIDYCNKLKAETPPLGTNCVNANFIILGTPGGGKHYYPQGDK